MKIRNGFVSNSSSSSFVVIGTTINRQQFEERRKEIEKAGLDCYKYDTSFSALTDFYFNPETGVDEIFDNDWSETVLFGIDVEGSPFPNIAKKAKEVAEALGVKEDELRIEGWSYYNG